VEEVAEAAAAAAAEAKVLARMREASAAAAVLLQRGLLELLREEGVPLEKLSRSAVEEQLPPRAATPPLPPPPPPPPRAPRDPALAALLQRARCEAHLPRLEAERLGAADLLLLSEAELHGLGLGVGARRRLAVLRDQAQQEDGGLARLLRALGVAADAPLLASLRRLEAGCGKLWQLTDAQLEAEGVPLGVRRHLALRAATTRELAQLLDDAGVVAGDALPALCEAHLGGCTELSRASEAQLLAAGLGAKDARRLRRYFEDAPSLAWRGGSLPVAPREETPRGLPSDVWVWSREVNDPVFSISLRDQMCQPISTADVVYDSGAGRGQAEKVGFYKHDHHW
jgi:hypothetical protein